MPRFKDEKDVTLDRYHHTIEITGFKGSCPFCKHDTNIETDQMGNNVLEEFCNCFVCMDDVTGVATYIKNRLK